MIVCAQCGEHNAAGTEFCGKCGEFLEWEGKRAEPVAVQPGEMAAAPAGTRPQVSTLRKPQPGDLICGECGTGNAQERKFCSRCGTSLTEAEVTPLPWWRRLFGGRGQKQFKAGTRPGRDGAPRRTGRGAAVRRGVSRVVKWTVAGVVVLCGGMYALVAPFRQSVNSTAVSVAKDVESIFVTRYTPVRPTALAATAELPDHGASLVGDNAGNTHWAAPAPTAPAPALVMRFDRPVDLRRAIVRAGIGEDFQAAHRPKRLHLVYSTGQTHDVDLADTPDPQEVELANSAGATSVEIHVATLYPSLRGRDVAISEIELFERN